MNIHQQTVLLVDDESDLLVIIEKMLQQNGYDVHAFVNPIKALDHIRVDGCKSCNIIISDIRMPVLSGTELAKQLLEFRPEIKIILMTAFNTNKAEAELVAGSNITAFLNKPFRSNDLVEAMNQIARR